MLPSRSLQHSLYGFNTVFFDKNMRGIQVGYNARQTLIQTHDELLRGYITARKGGRGNGPFQANMFD